MSTSDSQGRKPRLTKKQFIIGIAAICGIALIIEAVLLVRMLTKQQEKVNGEENTPTPTESVAAEQSPESYMLKVYITSFGGERELGNIEQYEYDSEGRLSHKYAWEATSYRGYPYNVESSWESYYSYDEKDRVIREDRKRIDDYITLEERYESKDVVLYEYKEGEVLEVFIQTVDENGNPKNTVEEKYNDAGTCIARTEYEYYDGEPKKTKEITYNDFGEILSSVQVVFSEEGELRQTTKEQNSYYETGIKKTSSEQYYDENGLLKTCYESQYNEYGVEISQSKLDEGNMVPVIVYDEKERKSVKTTGNYMSSNTEEWLFDEKGRIIKKTRKFIENHSERDSLYEKTTEEEFFYSEKGGESAVRATYINTLNGKTDTKETTYDSSGRILEKIIVSRDGEETKALYDWNYKDWAHPSKNVLQITVYQNGNLIREARYLVYPVTKEDQREWCWSYGELNVCLHWDIHNQKCIVSDRLSRAFEDYISPVGQYHLEPYYIEEYDTETETWIVGAQASFDAKGRIKSLMYRDEYNHLHTWDFDDRGNQIRAEERYEDGRIIETVECEYTYYTTSSEAENQ